LTPATPARGPNFTAHELSILFLLAAGYSNAGIIDALHPRKLTKCSIKYAVNEISMKFGIPKLTLSPTQRRACTVQAAQQYLSNGFP
jgi:hypothetical protein